MPTTYFDLSHPHRNGLYDESLALAEFVTGLEQKHFTKEIQNNNMEEGAVVVDKDIVEAEDEIPSIIHSIAAEVCTLISQ